MTTHSTRERPHARGVYEAALRAPGHGLWASHPGGRRPLPLDLWLGGLAPGDETLVDGCAGPTLDVGCGPGRITAALARRGVRALGIDIAAGAVALARRAGAAAMCLDVFGPVPGSGHWREIVLADGNIGIGGDPARLLLRAAELLAAGGRILVEVDGPGRPTECYWTTLETAALASAPFRWAAVGVDGIGPLAAEAGLTVTEVRQRASRYVTCLEPVQSVGTAGTAGTAVAGTP
ncbi:Class I SAM-dependent methyltransferase [Frankia sp. Hr75.2]|nr:Class I SAM-dependent methyltransferase [Frankia sp. Hr75.2]